MFRFSRYRFFFHPYNMGTWLYSQFSGVTLPHVYDKAHTVPTRWRPQLCCRQNGVAVQTARATSLNSVLPDSQYVFAVHRSG